MTTVRKNWSWYNSPLPMPTMYSTDFKRHIPLIHENIPIDNVLRSKVKEFTMVIDSTDRDIVQYPNPFYYRVTIGPQVQQKITEFVRDEYGYVLKDPITNQPITNSFVVQTPGPIIKEKIVWIKYIRLVNAVLPRANSFSICNETQSNVLDEDSSTQIQIKELTGQISPYKYSTNDNLTDCFAILFDNYIMNKHFYMSMHDGTGIIYDESLSSLNYLSVSIRNSNGKQLEYPFLKNCKCCNSNCNNNCCDDKKKIENICFSPSKNESVSHYGGMLTIDLEPLVTNTFSIKCTIDLIKKTIKGECIDITYTIKQLENKEQKITIKGTFMQMYYDITTYICKNNDTYEGNFKGCNISMTKGIIDNIDGNIKFVIQNSEIDGTVSYTFGNSRITIPFVLPFTTKDDKLYTCDHNITYTIYPQSFIENVALEYITHYVCSEDSSNITLKFKIGTLILKVDINTKTLTLDGSLTGKLFDKNISLTIFVVNGAGSIVGMFGKDDVSLILQFDDVNGIFNIKGRVGCEVMNYSYTFPFHPVTLDNWMQFYGSVTDVLNINRKIPICLNLSKMNVVVGKNIYANLTHYNNKIVFETYQIENNKKHMKYIGSYNFNNKYRMPVEMNKLHDIINMNFFGTPNTTVVVNKSRNGILGKIMAGFPPIINYDFENKNNEIVLVDVPTGDTTCLHGVINEECISVTDCKNISFGMIETCIVENNIKTTKSCCDCVVSPKDFRLQNQLYFKIGLVVDDIPIIFNKQQ